MANVSVTLNGGTAQENTQAVTLETKRWGLNGDPWGTVHAIPQGSHTLTVYKTTAPKQLSITVQIPSQGTSALKVKVNQNDIAVTEG